KKEDSKGKEGKEKLVVWSAPLTDHDADAWKPIFEKENNCEIEFQIVPWDNYAEKYATAISAGEGPDIGYMYAEMFPQFIEMGAVEDLTPYLE
ncbi:sugar ABC transporter substrate-binding protein, partial [Clostridioides difficile]